MSVAKPVARSGVGLGILSDSRLGARCYFSILCFAMPPGPEQQLVTTPAKGWFLPPRFRSSVDLTLKSSAPGPWSGQGNEVMRPALEKWLFDAVMERQPVRPEIFLGDDGYYLPDAKEVEAIWNDAKWDELDVRQQRFDCDDYAWVMKGHASRYAYFRSDWGQLGIGVGFVAGYLWRPNHAANFFIEGQTLRFIEPRDGTLHSLSECTSILQMFI